VRDFFNVELFSVVFISLHLENVFHFDIFELDESLFVVRAKFDHINVFEILFQNAFKRINVNH
jgi:hypothetical protein